MEQPVLVITDIGADIDDTLALFALLGATKTVKVVGFVTCVNDGQARGALLRGFLRILGYPDSSFPIFPYLDHNTAGCYIPESFPNIREANIGKVEDTPQNIINLCKKYSKQGISLLGIAGLTPLADAIKLDNQNGNILSSSIKRIYLQGNCRILRSNGKVRLAPLDIAYNFRVDMSASNIVFEHFQQYIPFVLLGKFAAYQIPITKRDFISWTKNLQSTREILHKELSEGLPHAPNLLTLVTEQMRMFRSKRPDIFDTIYNIPQHLSEEEKQSFSWFDQQDDKYVCSHPYDPLLALLLIQDSMNTSQDKHILFREEEIINENGVKHILVGNESTSNSIEHVELVHNALVNQISKGISPFQDA